MIKARNFERESEELHLNTATLIPHVQGEKTANMILNIGKQASHAMSTEGPAGRVMALRLMGGPPPCCNGNLEL